MQLMTKVLPNDHNIFLFGDQHGGCSLSSVKGWAKLLSMMHSEYDGCSNNYGADMGDMVEAIMVDDKRFSPDRLKDPLPQEQLERAIEDRESIKGQLLTILQGNHELGLWKWGNITAKACEKLGVSYGTYTARITIQNTRNEPMYKIYMTHGWKNMISTADDPLRREVNQQLILKRHLKMKAGDCAVMVKGHAHKLIVCKPKSELFLSDDGNKITQHYTSWGQNEQYIHPDARWYGCTGSFLKLHGKGISGYAEMKEYDPVELGWLVLRIRDRKIVSLDPVYLNI